jgi:hypothetical protein
MALFVALIAALAAGAALANADDDELELDPFNYAFAAYAGSGIYATGAGTVYLFRIPVSYNIRRADEHAFGIRLRAKATLGFYDFDPEDLLELELPDRVGTATLLVGLEFPIPVLDNWTLGPFLDYGPAWDDESEQLSWVLGSGARSRAQFPWGNGRQWVLWNELVAAANFGDDEIERDDFGKFVTELELQLPLPARAYGRRLALAPFFKSDYYFNEIRVRQVVGEPLDIRERWEVGVKFGTYEREKVWRVALPRVGVGVRFGQGATAVRIIFSSKY